MKNKIILAAIIALVIGVVIYFANSRSPNSKIVMYDASNEEAGTYTDFELDHYAATRGNPEADVAYLFLQGGPSDKVLTFMLVDEALPSLGGDEDAFYVMPHQIQTREPKRFNKAPLTFKQSVSEAETSTKIAGEVIQHLNAQGKKVHVIGVSYGAFIATDLIAEFGNIAESYMIIVGRLDMNEEVWRSFSEGQPMAFENGKTPIKASVEEAGMGTGTEIGDRNMIRLAAGLGHHRYTELLANTDMSNVTYITGLQDAQVGVLTDAEIKFLEGQGAEVLILDTTHEGSMLDPECIAAFRKLFGKE